MKIYPFFYRVKLSALFLPMILFFLPALRQLHAQKIKFGKVDRKEMVEKAYPGDTSAPAAILYKRRHTYFDVDPEHGFYVVDQYHYRIKIYKKEGLKYATKKIKAYKFGTLDETVHKIKAYTHNLHNGRVESKKMKSSAVFKEKTSRFYNTYKFTLPDVRPGSVIEYTYEIHSPMFLKIDDIYLQDEIPVKRVEARVSIPEYFKYNKKIKGFLPVNIRHGQQARTLEFPQHEIQFGAYGNNRKTWVSRLDFTENIYDVVLNNVPALRDEPYSGNIRNFMAGIVMELSAVDFPQSPVRYYAASWKDVKKYFRNHLYFGQQLVNKEHFKKDMYNINRKAKTPEEKMRAIFSFIKNKIKWDGFYTVTAPGGIVTAFRKGSGSSGEINLNLVAMLQAAGLIADPVVLSTVSHGIPVLPTIIGFNHVIARVRIGDRTYLLDATDPYSLPDVLPDEDLNFKGLVINDALDEEWVNLYPDNHSLEANVVQATFSGSDIKGFLRSDMNRNILLDFRKRFAEKTDEEIKRELEEDYEGVEITNIRTSQIKNDNPKGTLFVQFESSENHRTAADKILLSPLLFLGIHNNPFKSEERKFPVFYNYPFIRSIIINLRIPDTYEIDNIPEKAVYTLPENLGEYSLEIKPVPGGLSVKSVFAVNTSVIGPQHYKALKEWYDKIIAKQREPVVLRKKQ